MAINMKFKAIVLSYLILFLWPIHAGAQGYSPPKYVAEEDGDKMIGSLQWEIRGSFFHWVTARGTTPIHLKDVTIEIYGPVNSRQANKRIQLTPEFAIELVDGIGDSKVKSGFGIKGEKKNTNYYSWEWFLVDEGKLAVKLQEKGTPGIEIKNVSIGTEITRIDFLTDISIRLLSGPHLKRPVFYRIKILKGSSITWPSVVNGKVVAN
jgi:hypothetical protein